MRIDDANSIWEAAGGADRETVSTEFPTGRLLLRDTWIVSPFGVTNAIGWSFSNSTLACSPGVMVTSLTGWMTLSGILALSTRISLGNICADSMMTRELEAEAEGAAGSAGGGGNSVASTRLNELVEVGVMDGDSLGRLVCGVADGVLDSLANTTDAAVLSDGEGLGRITVLDALLLGLLDSEARTGEELPLGKASEAEGVELVSLAEAVVEMVGEDVSERVVEMVGVGVAERVVEMVGEGVAERVVEMVGVAEDVVEMVGVGVLEGEGMKLI